MTTDFQGTDTKDSAGAGSSRTAGRSSVLAAVGVLAVLGIGVPLLVARHYGALGIPRSDDWSYLVTLFRLVDSGRLSFNHWVSMSLVGQLVLAAPIAVVTNRDIAAIQDFTAVIGFVGLCCIAQSPKCFGAPRRVGVLLAATIAAGPLWGPLSASFMTDVPAFAISAAALYFALAAFGRRPISPSLLTTSLLLGFCAFTIRQYSIVIVASALITGTWYHLASGERVRAKRLILTGCVLAIAAALFTVWWNTVPDGYSLSPRLADAHSMRVTVIKGAGFLRLLGVLALPILLYCGPLRLVRRSWHASRALTLAVASMSTVWLLATASRVPNDLFVGNYIERDGVLSDIVLIGHRPDVLPGNVWTGLVTIATVAAVILAVAVIPAVLSAGRRIRERDYRLTDPLGMFLTLTVLGYVAVYVCAMASGLQVYDRYILPVLPPIGLLLVRAREPDGVRPARGRSRSEPRVLAAAAGFVALAVIGFAFTTDSASFDGARWRAAVAATKQGWAVRQVNGGFEWLNYHRGDKVKLRGRDTLRSALPDTKSGTRICVTVHINPHHVLKHVVAIVTSSAPTRETARLVAFRTNVPCHSRADRSLRSGSPIP